MTIIDRSTDWQVMRKLPHGKDANEAAKTIVHLLEPYRKWIKTITTDNGAEKCTLLILMHHGKKVASKTQTASLGNTYQTVPISRM